MFNGYIVLSLLLGLIQVMGALAYLAVSVRQISSAARSNRAGRTDRRTALRIVQAVFGPVLLLLSGLILLWQGWRLDLLLLSKDLLITILIGYLITLDVQKSS